MNKEMLIEQVGALFVNGMPFNQFLNISVESLSPEQAKITFPWQDVFIGNPAQKILHGGIISAVLDNVGGMLAAGSAIDKLNEEQKTAYILKNIQGLSYKKIAEIMNKSTSSIESLIFRAKKSLKLHLIKKMDNKK